MGGKAQLERPNTLVGGVVCRCHGVESRAETVHQQAVSKLRTHAQSHACDCCLLAECEAGAGTGSVPYSSSLHEVVPVHRGPKIILFFVRHLNGASGSLGYGLLAVAVEDARQLILQIPVMQTRVCESTLPSRSVGHQSGCYSMTSF